MLELLTDSIGAIIGNMILFLIIPFVWWIIKWRKKISFFKWVGIIKLKLVSNWKWIIVFIIAHCFFYLFDIIIFMNDKDLEVLQVDENVSSNIYAGLGLVAVIPALLKTFIANGFCEEVLFRGFISKRLINKFGKISGIIIQGILFGFMHNVIYMLVGVEISLQYHIVLFIFTGMGGLLLGILDEKIYNGSIISSIVLHGLGNFITNLSVMF